MIIGAQHRMVIGTSENIKAKSKKDALRQLETYKGKYDNVWNSTIKFNLKETIKLLFLNLLGVESIEIKIKGKENKEK